ncbi:coiled-coil domain-containing protein 191 isoform X1 [Sorex araneus]|uniref:coiled-coil domain-containing protein 191 isoform X1 n=1 Tax=Sorex araneus TaxID=42254 RepID=UPI0024338324|nr:coiled-coil domain-containing protein 191 isoform X1 [Sorex araneus]
MLLAPQEGSSSRKRTELNRWRQFTRKPNPQPAFDPDNVEHWMKKVEKASEFAVSKVFSSGNSDVSKRLLDQIIDLEASEQIEDHDEIYAEAQELVNDWLDIRLQQELASDGEDDAEAAVPSVPPVLETHHHLKYDKFDDLCDYLEEEEEGDTVKKFIDHLLHKDVVDSGVLDDLRMKENQDQKQQKDPRLTMEMRHKQVKENRLRREKKLECQRIERNLKKTAILEAQYLVQEEKKRKALEAKKEEEEIRREMVKLRREIIERRVTVEEAWKLEKKKQEERTSKNPEKCVFQNVHIQLDEEKMAKERKKKLKELLIQTFKENHQCQKRYFSAWHKLILDHRIQLGKAGTLSDWKLQLKVLRAWRDYTRSQKLKRETQAMENELREENRKQQVATEYNRKQVLQHHFTEWQHWLRAETLKRELTVTKEETRKKMNALLEAASLGKLCTGGSSAVGPHQEAAAVGNPPESSGEVTIVPPLWEEPLSGSSGYLPSPSAETPTEGSLQVPFHSAPDKGQPQLVDAQPARPPRHREKLLATSQKEVPICAGRAHSRQAFQQQLIEKQKKKLQEQKKVILELKEKQRLTEARWARELAAAVTSTQIRLLSNPREETKRTRKVLSDLPLASPGTEDCQSDSRNSLSGLKKSPQQKMAPHPILKAMEERAVHRTERRRILAEKKKQKEEEKLAQLKAQEEEHQKREAEEKEAQLKKKREEKRLMKMKELERQKRIQRNQQLEALAREHYERVLLRKKGLEPWKKLRLQSEQNLQVAREHYSLALQRKCLLTWCQWSRENMVKKTAQSDQFYSQMLLRRAVRHWAQYLAAMKEEIQKIREHFLQKKIFRAWWNVAREAKLQSQRKQEVAAEHHTRRTAWITFQTWKTFTRLMKEERVKEERREQLRRKVAEILPDFRAPSPP